MIMIGAGWLKGAVILIHCLHLSTRVSLSSRHKILFLIHNHQQPPKCQTNQMKTLLICVAMIQMVWSLEKVATSAQLLLSPLGPISESKKEEEMLQTALRSKKSLSTSTLQTIGTKRYDPHETESAFQLWKIINVSMSTGERVQMKVTNGFSPWTNNTWIPIIPNDLFPSTDLHSSMNQSNTQYQNRIRKQWSLSHIAPIRTTKT